MPNFKDFSDINDIKEIEVSPKGWVNPLFIEYGIDSDIKGVEYFWRVKGTKHTFVIPLRRMNYLSSGDHAKHFTEILEKFKDEYDSWKDYEEIPPWVGEYQNEYRYFIL